MNEQKWPSPGHRYYEHLGSRFPIVVVSDSLAAQLGAAPAEKSSSNGISSGSSGAGGQPSGAFGASAPSGGAEEDAELEVLLRQLDINTQHSQLGAGGPAAWSSSSWAVALAPAPPANDEDLSFLESLGLGDEPAAAAPARPQAAAASSGAAGTADAAGGLAGGPAAALGPGVHIMTAEQYFSRFYGSSPAVWDVYESRVQTLAEERSAGPSGAAQGAGAGGGFKPHLSSAAVDLGLSQGALLQARELVERWTAGCLRAHTAGFPCC